MGKHLEGIEIAVIHVFGIRHTLVRIGPFGDAPCTGETRGCLSRMSQEVPLAVRFLERERHVNRTGIRSFCIKRGGSCRQVEYITRTIQGSRTIGIRCPADEIKSFHQTRFADGDRILAVHRVLVCDSIAFAAVVIIMNMPIGVRGYELDSAVRISTVNMDTRPTVAVDNRTATDNRHRSTLHRNTPSRNIRARVGSAIFGTGKHRSFDGQSGVLRRDMPHLLTRPNCTICIRNQPDITAGIGTQEISTGLELHTKVLFARLRRIHYHTSESSSRCRLSQVLDF